jgi:hypothetical protein
VRRLDLLRSLGIAEDRKPACELFLNRHGCDPDVIAEAMNDIADDCRVHSPEQR